MASLPIQPDDSAPDTSKPTGPDEDGTLFPRLKGWVQASIEHLTEWRKEAEESYAFYSGDQWTDDEKSAFQDDQRVAPVFNLVAINVDAVCGLEVNNRQDVKYLPRTAGDVKVNGLLSSVAMWIRDQAHSESEESDAFRDAVVTGLGVTETRKATGDPSAITIDRRNPLECFYDKSSQKPNLTDRRHGGRIVWMDTDEAEQMFPKRTPTELNAKWAVLGTTSDKDGKEPLDCPDHQRDGVGIPNNRPKKVCLVEVEWYDWQEGRKVYQQAFLGNVGVLEVNRLESWAYNFITGKRDTKKAIWYGIVRALKDPQRMINKFLATLIHILATNAKGGLLYERGVFTDARAAEKDWSNPQKNVEVAEGALARKAVQPRVAPPLPAGAVQLLEFAVGNIRSVSGVNVELLGAADRDQPASLELQRRQSAVTILASLFDAKKLYHEEQGRTLIALMKTIPPETLVRITVDMTDPQQVAALAPPGTPPEVIQQAMQQAQDQQQREMFVQFQLIAQALSDPSIKYDVIVDEAPTSPNQQQEIIAKLQMLASQGIQFPPKALATVIQNIGLPATVADDLASAFEGGGEEDPRIQQMQQIIQQGAQQLQQAQQDAAQAKSELEGVKMDKSIEAEKVKIDGFKAQTDRMKVQADIVQQARQPAPMPAGAVE